MGANRGTGFKNNKIFTSYLMGTPYNGKVIPISNVGSGFNEEIFGQISKLVE
jgi:ATP-dependent DNA ligase